MLFIQFKMFHNIALSGGGVHTIAFIGCVKYLQETKQIDDIYNVIGTSGGSTIALMIVLNFTWNEMIQIFFDICKDDNCKPMYQFSIKDLLKVFKKYGMNEGTIIIHTVEKILQQKNMDKDITFLELTKKVGKNLIIPVTNLTQNKIEYLSIDTYPEMKVLTAIRMSSAIPILFEPIKYYTDIYVDGLIYNNFPIDYFDKFTVDTLGLNIVIKDKKDIHVKTFKDYIYLLIESFFSSLYEKKHIIKYEYICDISIPSDIKNFDLYKLQFVMKKDNLQRLVDVGYESLHHMLVQESK